MRDPSKDVKQGNSAIILIGSNINPEANIKLAIYKLSTQFQIKKISSTWETAAIGSHSDNFLNLALFIQTNLSSEDLKLLVLRKLEQELGRVRTDDKNAPRPMDLDIIVYNGRVIEAALWERAYVALPVAELAPDLIHPETSESLWQCAKRLQKDTFAVIRPELQVKLK